MLIASNSSYAGTTRTVIIAEDHRTVTRGHCFGSKGKSYLAYHGIFMKMFCCVYIGFELSRIINDSFTLYLNFSGYAEIKVCIAKYSFVIKRYSYIHIVIFVKYRSVWNMFYTSKIVFRFHYILVNLDVPDILKDISAEQFFVSLFIYEFLKLVKFGEWGADLFLISAIKTKVPPL